jgi:hypothetical protein
VKTITARFNKASLTVRINVDPASSAARWGLTVDETRALIRHLTYAVAEGEGYLAELKAGAAVDTGQINAKTGEGHP